jgi:hypothetical protein
MLTKLSHVNINEHIPGSTVLLSEESIGLGVSWRTGAFRNSISAVIDAIIQLTNSVPMNGCSNSVRLIPDTTSRRLPVCA